MAAKETAKKAWRKYRGWPVWLQIVVALFALGVLSAAANPKKTPASKNASSTKASVATDAKRTTTTVDSDGIDPDEIGAPDPNAAAPVAVTSIATSQSSACRADPLANIYHPDRLQVIDPCKTVTGIVETVRAEDDGDAHVNVRLDSAFANLINDKNVSGEHGDLVVEVVPADRPGCTVGQPPKPATGTYDYGTCTGANVATPSVGQHVSVTGPYVLDRHHGWMEIHPAWAIDPVSEQAPTTTTKVVTTAAPTTTAARVTTPAPAPAPAPTTTAGQNIAHPGAFCSEHGEYGYTSSGTRMQCTTTATDSRYRWRAA